MSLKLCLVCPYTLTGAHPVAEHVRGVATGLADRGHLVTVLAPSSSSHALRAGRRRLRALAGGDTDAVTALDGQPLVVAVAPGGATAAARATARSRTAGGRQRQRRAGGTRGQVRHRPRPRPAPPGVATAALKHSQGLTAATFHADRRAGAHLPGAHLVARALPGTHRRPDRDQPTRRPSWPAEFYPGDYTQIPAGIVRPHSARREARHATWWPSGRPRAGRW